jgi:hypothetical protein
MSSSSELLLLFPVAVMPAGAMVMFALPPELEAVDTVDVAAVVDVVVADVVVAVVVVAVVVVAVVVVVVVLLVEDDAPVDPLQINGACTKMLAVTADPVT